MPGERATFLASVRALLSPGDALLLGTDLVKDESVLVAAYDDAAGVTVALCRSFVLSVVRPQCSHSPFGGSSSLRASPPQSVNYNP